jgi:hypothetical protein
MKKIIIILITSLLLSSANNADLGSRISATNKTQKYIQKYAKNNIIQTAIQIIAGSDLADIKDLQLLEKFITQFSLVTSSDVISILKSDHDLLRKAFTNCRPCAAPLRSQLKQMIKAERAAIKLMQEHPELARGIISPDLSNAKSHKLVALRTTLFYSAALSNNSNFKLILPKLKGFYRGELPDNKFIKGILTQTNLVYDNIFYTPTIYVKNADQELPVDKNLNILFSDCSGFITHIAKKLYPEINLEDKPRLTTKHLAAFYDLLANLENYTTNTYYNPAGSQRDLTKPERASLGDLDLLSLETLNALQKIFVPVTSLDNLQAGDVLIRRHPYGFHDKRAPEKIKGAEGHALLVVDPLPRNNPLCLELTSFHGVGYNWRRQRIKSGLHNQVWRILRFARD